jgi:tRNA threonylcarbamoyladenosine biosynthesis protein TsaB
MRHPALNLLALDTSTDWCSAALWLAGRVLFRETHAGQRHSELILPMIDGLLAEACLELSALDGVAFGAGPGSFTGIRIACGVAQGLAFGAGLRVAAVGTLDCLAEASGAARVIACLDARIGDVYLAASMREGEVLRSVVAPCVCRPEQAPAVAGAGWVGCGSGFAAYGEALRQRYGASLGEVHPGIVPHAREVAALGARAFARGEGVDPAQAAPLYVRDKVALSVAERAQRRGASAGRGS